MVSYGRPIVRVPWKFECPQGWQVVSRWGDGWAVKQREGDLRVVIDCDRKDDGQEWIHVSYSCESRVPSHADTVLVKETFIGDRYAYAVFPPKSNYVNIHPNCLHLWAMWCSGEGRVLPEFSKFVPGVGTSI